MIPAAILFDLNNGGNKIGVMNLHIIISELKLQLELQRNSRLGNVGAGYGAKAGSLKGGLGGASFENKEGLKIGGLFAVNSFGSVVNYETGQFWGASES